MKNTKILLVLVAPLSMVWALPTTAQEASGVADAPKLEEIIVTARKRRESELKVPVVEAVLSSEDLARAQVVDLRGVTQQVPGLKLGNSVLTVGTQVALRGVGTSSLDAGVDQSVSLNIDGLQFSQGSTFNVGLFDMAQIEVLKGPQALFFGKNSPGGVISVRTADPGPALEVIVRGSYEFEAREKRGELILSGPVSETLGLRLSIMDSSDDGYFFNKATALPGTGAKDPSSRYDINDNQIYRLTAVWKPTDEFSARVKVNHAESKVVGGGQSLGSCPDGKGAPAGLQFINPNDDCTVNRTLYIDDVDPAAFPDVSNNGVPFLKSIQDFGTMELNYDLARDLTLTSTTGYFKTNVNGFINGANSAYVGTPLTADNDFLRRDFTQELRLQSDFADSKLNFLAGGYYQNARMKQRVFVGGNLALGLPRTLLAGINDVSIKAISAFGQLRYKPISKLEIALGARWTDEKRHDDASSIASINAVPVPITITKPDLKSTNVSPELTLTYTPTDDLTLFAAAKKGYKSGSYIITVPASPGKDNSFGDEEVKGGEIGLKGRTPDRSLTFSAAIYDYKYSGLQVGANEVAEDGIPVVRTINAASAKVYGVDTDVTYRPSEVEGLSTRLGVNWNHARFEEFKNAQCSGGQRIADGCNLAFDPSTGRFNGQDLSGFPLPKAATWQANGSVDYEMPVGSSLRLGFGANGEYTTKFLKDLGNRSDFYQPAYFKVGANIALKSADDSWELALIGTNLTNKFTAGNCTNFSAATGSILLSPLTGAATRNIAGVDELACSVDPGRQVFLRVTYRPFAN